MDIPLDPSKIYKKIFRAGIIFFSSIYNFKSFNNLLTACHKLYLKNQGYDSDEIRFILMIHGAIIRGTIRKELRKCERE